MSFSSSFPGRALALLLAFASAAAAVRLYPHELPPARHPDLLAVIFYSPAMVFTGRVTLLCLAVFAVLSIAARIARREWLLRAGPFEVERAPTSLEAERDQLRAEVAEWRERAQWLEAEMAMLDAARPQRDTGRAEDAAHNLGGHDGPH